MIYRMELFNDINHDTTQFHVTLMNFGKNKIVPKYVTVAETQTQTVCERQGSISMSCPSGTTITVTHSFYGRADKTTCTTHPNGGQWGQAQLRKTNCVSSKAGGIIGKSVEIYV